MIAKDSLVIGYHLTPLFLVYDMIAKDSLVIGYHLTLLLSKTNSLLTPKTLFDPQKN